MKTRADVRQEIDELKRQVAQTGIGAEPLVVECFRRGDFGETRPPGLYWTHPDGGRGPNIVYEGGEPPEELLAQFRPDGRPGPLVITFGPEGGQ
jgi:hypothetical protein